MSDATTRATSVRRYIFYNEHRPSRAWMPTLEMINDRFSQYLRSALLQHLRPGVEVTPPIAIQLVSHRELLERFTVPSYLTLANFKPLHGMILVGVDAQLVSWVVESRFGGDGRFPLTINNREFSPFEQKSARRVVETIVRQFALAWKPIGVFEPEIVRHEINPQFAGIANSSELVIFSTFDVRLGQGGGKLTICVPYASLEPLHDRLMTGSGKTAVDRDPRWHEALTKGVGQSTMLLRVELTKIEISVRDLLEMQPGTVVEIDRPESVTVEANSLALFRGRWGRHGRRIGVRVEERLLPAFEIPPQERSARTGVGGDDER